MRRGILAALALVVVCASSTFASDLSCDNNGRCTLTAGELTQGPHSAHKAAKRARGRQASHPAGGGIVSVDTAAGIKIRVAADFAGPIKAVIADLVARGIKPKQIHCFATHGHVRGSRHYSGHACDFDFYRGCMGCSARWTRNIGDIVAAHGLRNGCSFGDCGHIDDGARLARQFYRRGRAG